MATNAPHEALRSLESPDETLYSVFLFILPAASSLNIDAESGFSSSSERRE